MTITGATNYIREQVIADPVSLFVGSEFSSIATKCPHSSLQSATSMQVEEQTDRADLDFIAGGSAFSFGQLTPYS
jgi:hypothetical protein